MCVKGGDIFSEYDNTVKNINLIAALKKLDLEHQIEKELQDKDFAALLSKLTVESLDLHDDCVGLDYLSSEEYYQFLDRYDKNDILHYNCL